MYIFIGDNMIYLLRKEYFLNQKDISIYLNTNQSNYSDIENKNILDIKAIYIIKLCILYNISLEYMYGITNEYSELPNRDKLIEKYKIDKKYLNYLENKMKESNLKVKDIDISRTKENINKLLNQR